MPNHSALRMGITGGIGSGKSLISRIFATLGIPVYDADSRAKWIMSYHEGLKSEIITFFGEEAYLPTGQLNRAYLANLTFHNGEKLAVLNSIVHPKVGQDYLTWAEAHAKAPYLLKEAALLYESNSYQSLDKTITVYAPIEVRIGRVLQRDPQRSKGEIVAIIDKQMNEEERMRRADYVIYNDGSQLVIPQVLALHEQFLGLAKS